MSQKVLQVPVGMVSKNDGDWLKLQLADRPAGSVLVGIDCTNPVQERLTVRPNTA
jgi:hypothetical protein